MRLKVIKYMQFVNIHVHTHFFLLMDKLLKNSNQNNSDSWEVAMLSSTEKEKKTYTKQ